VLDDVAVEGLEVVGDAFEDGGGGLALGLVELAGVLSLSVE
jgi:hypothetical protein